MAAMRKCAGRRTREQVHISLSLLLRKREETVCFAPAHLPTHLPIMQNSVSVESVWSSVHLPPACDFSCL